MRVVRPYDLVSLIRETTMVVGDVIQVKFFCRHAGGQNAVNIREWTATAVATPAPTIVEVANQLVGNIGSKLKPCIGNAWQFQGAKYRLVRPNPTIFALTTSNAGPGALVGESLPPQIAGLISLRSTAARPRCRGRFYVACPTEVESDPGGKPIASLQTLYATLGAELIKSVQVNSAGGGQMTLLPTIFSKRQDGTTASFVLDTVLVRKSFATQRRRSLINKGDVDEFS